MNLPGVPPGLRMGVLSGGGFRCVACHERTGQVDHVRPRHAGGLAVPVNLAPLCGPCNRVKSCYFPGHGYHPLTGADDVVMAAAILESELLWLADRHSPREINEHVWRFFDPPYPGSFEAITNEFRR